MCGCSMPVTHWESYKVVQFESLDYRLFVFAWRIDQAEQSVVGEGWMGQWAEPAIKSGVLRFSPLDRFAQRAPVDDVRDTGSRRYPDPHPTIRPGLVNIGRDLSSTPTAAAWLEPAQGVPAIANRRAMLTPGAR